MSTDDPTVVHTVVVTTDDVVAALESNLRRDAGAVLRLTPPFAGRMRGRLHVAGAEGDYDSPAPVHLEPEHLVDPVPAFPTPDATADALRADSTETYTTERHRRRHESAVEEWRKGVRESIVESTSIAVGESTLSFDVKTLE